MVTSKELLIERRATVILDRTLFSVASSVLILQCYLCIFIWSRPDEANVGFEDSYCTAWSRLKLNENRFTHSLHPPPTHHQELFLRVLSSVGG